MSDVGGRRLWIGNLDERITEFTLLKILQKYGKIEQFDFLFHKSGPNQGKPRGYCFASFENRTDAVHAIHALDGKLALGKKLAVKWAHSHIKVPSEPVPLEPVINLHPDKLPGSLGGHLTKVPEEPTTKKKVINASVETQIRAIEGKLREMDRKTSKATFKPIPVYNNKNPKPPTIITTKCLPSLLSIHVEPPPNKTEQPSSASSSTAPSSSSAPTSTSEQTPQLTSDSSTTPSTTIAASESAPPTSSLSPPSSQSSPPSDPVEDIKEASTKSDVGLQNSAKMVKSLVVRPTRKDKSGSRPKPYDKR